MKTQRGFTIIEVVMIVVILGVLGLVGWRACTMLYQTSAASKPVETQVGDISNVEDLKKADTDLQDLSVSGNELDSLEAETAY